MNKSVNEAFKKLEGIQAAEAPKDLFAEIQNRLGEGKVIPLRWVRLAAAVIMLLLATEFYWITQYQSENKTAGIETLLSSSDNGFYYEEK